MIEMTAEEALEELTQANFHSEERALRKRIEALEECLDGCLHFDDGFVRSDVLGNALSGWRERARQLLNKED